MLTTAKTPVISDWTIPSYFRCVDKYHVEKLNPRPMIFERLGDSEPSLMIICSIMLHILGLAYVTLEIF